MNGKFKDSGFSGKAPKKKSVQTAQYKGKLRLLGTIEDSSKKVLGYLCIEESTGKFFTYNEQQLRLLLKTFKFSNMRIGDTGKLVNTECAIDSLPVYNLNLQVTSNPGLTIIGEIIQNFEAVGYKIIDDRGKIADVNKETALELSNKYRLVNAKVVNGKSRYISAIKEPFSKILITEKEVVQETYNKKSETDLWRKKKHLDKLINIWCFGRIKAALYGKFTILNIYGFEDINRELKILVNEFIKPLSVSNSVTKDELGILTNTLTNGSMSKDINSVENRERVYTVMQFVLNDEKLYAEFIRDVKINRVVDRSILHKIEEDGNAVSGLSRLLKELDKKKMEQVAKVEEKQDREFKITSFISDKDVAQLGLTTNLDNKGFEFKKHNGNKVKLKYIGDYLWVIDYESYLSSAKCFGDVGILAQIEKTLSSEYFDEKEIFIRVEVMLAILAIYNKDMAIRYMKDREDALGYEMLPNIDMLETVKESISEEIEVYYQSAFNVFKRDEGKYKVDHLKRARYINYRALGIKRRIIDVKLEELATILNVVTSERCTEDNICECIGNLRVI